MTQRYVFVTDELPRLGAAGHLALNAAILRWLRELGHEVVVLLVGARLAAPVERYGLAPVAGPRIRALGDRVAVLPGSAAGVIARGLARRLPAGLAARLRGARHQADAVLGSFASPEDIAWCVDYIATYRPDAVLVDTIFRAGLLHAPELRGVNSVLIAHDVFHRRHAALVAAGYRVRPAVLSRADEAAWLCGARYITAIQPEEARLLQAMCPMQHVFTMVAPALPCPPAGAERIAGRLVFIGSANLPNLDGLRWFFREVWPLLAGRGVTLDLAGDCGAALGQVPLGVFRLGRVAELAPVLHRAALAVAPLQVGSGLKIKLLDYARHGLFTVATPVSLEGFAPDPAAPFGAAADANGFTEAVLRHLENPPDARMALDYVTRHYGLETSFAALGKAISASSF